MNHESHRQHAYTSLVRGTRSALVAIALSAVVWAGVVAGALSALGR